MKPSFPFSWQPHSLKYLGIYLTSNLSSLFHRNYIPLLNSIKTDLQKWTQMAHSWLGRISIVKMNVLPRLLFMFQMIPYKIPPGFFRLVQSMICKFVLNRKQPRLAYKCLIKPKREGGLAIPDFKRYYLAIILNRISDWKYHKNSKNFGYS